MGRRSIHLLILMAGAAMTAAIYVFGGAIGQAAVLGVLAALSLEALLPSGGISAEEIAETSQMKAEIRDWEDHTSAARLHLYHDAIEFLQSLPDRYSEEDAEDTPDVLRQRSAARIAIGDMHNHQIIDTKLADRGMELISRPKVEDWDIAYTVLKALLLVLAKQEASLLLSQGLVKEPVDQSVPMRASMQETL